MKTRNINSPVTRDQAERAIEALEEIQATFHKVKDESTNPVAKLIMDGKIEENQKEMDSIKKYIDSLQCRCSICQIVYPVNVPTLGMMCHLCAKKVGW